MKMNSCTDPEGFEPTTFCSEGRRSIHAEPRIQGDYKRLASLILVSSSETITLFGLIKIYWRKIATLILINSLNMQISFEVYRSLRSEDERILT